MSTMTYAGLVDRASDGYGVYFPDLPGCTSMGDTMAELATNAREAVGLYLQVLAERGGSPPPATPAEDLREQDPEVKTVGLLFISGEGDVEPVHVSIRLPVTLLSSIDREADARGWSRSDFIAASARELLKAG